MNAKILVYSDLHLEFADFDASSQSYDIVVLAGDIGCGTQGVEWAIDRFPETPVVYICGNHEFYGFEMSKVWSGLRLLANGSNVHVLENETVVLNGIRFVCATLWTDGNLNGDSHVAHIRGQMMMNDYRVIRNGSNILTVDDTVNLHHESLSYLKSELVEEPVFDYPTVVVTHHAPSAHSLSGRRVDSSLSAFYASHLDNLIIDSQAALWIHGHTHESVDYFIGNTRVLSNPRGYARQKSGNGNAEFKVDCIIEI